ncbi:protein FAR1-RELATED SEQUENCE 5 isoform X2 [Cucumis melo var. makuwa]|uniref:Protein FAR1-RELATED SEQUENCE 5 isoform X2 n=1 Tax=Cucumis melo var. makuwa TaxID=1194695 RepID=A0A5D3D3Q6_CUCMM|nr:protein FAR1-RELATED SEQUENCE 5 isoform X2 [Cucumis melo var. makuwa]TYK17986.1 protein FAR1-RELATED SEQUENCE 5 isoform X2 [Cucumis melo var. makuwa]
MEFESEESVKVFYDAYASRLGFIMRVDAFRRSMRDGAVVWRRLVCNKEGFRKFKPKRSENRKPRAVTREGCKAMVVVKKEKTGKWVVTKFVKDHNHPLIVTPASARRNVLLSHTRFHFPYLCSGIIFGVAFTFALSNRNGLIELRRKGLLTSKAGTH